MGWPVLRWWVVQCVEGKMSTSDRSTSGRSTSRRSSSGRSIVLVGRSFCGNVSLLRISVSMDRTRLPKISR